MSKAAMFWFALGVIYIGGNALATYVRHRRYQKQHPWPPTESTGAK